MARQTHPRGSPGIPHIPGTDLELFSSTPPTARAPGSSLGVNFSAAPSPFVPWEEAERRFGGGRNAWKLAAAPLSLQGFGGVRGQASHSQPDWSQSCAWLRGSPFFWGVQSGLAGAEG